MALFNLLCLSRKHTRRPGCRKRGRHWVRSPPFKAVLVKTLTKAAQTIFQVLVCDLPRPRLFELGRCQSALNFWAECFCLFSSNGWEGKMCTHIQDPPPPLSRLLSPAISCTIFSIFMRHSRLSRWRRWCTMTVSISEHSSGSWISLLPKLTESSTVLLAGPCERIPSSSRNSLLQQTKEQLLEA